MTNTSLHHTTRTIGHVLRNHAGRWTVSGWVEHLNRKGNAYETVNSFLKHESELGDEATRGACLLLAFARCKDLGVDATEVSRFLAERREKRAMKAAESSDLID